jgi:hypothetical protein
LQPITRDYTRAVIAKKHDIPLGTQNQGFIPVTPVISQPKGQL